MKSLLDHLSERVLLCDGGIGSTVQSMKLELARDFEGRENCTDILTRTRPDIIRKIHEEFLRAGSDVIQTNTFGAAALTLKEFQLEDETFALNRRAGEIAREAIALFKDERERFVLGAIGPGTKLPSLGHVDYQTLEDSFALQSAGLIAGAVDAFLVETCQDPLQIKAAVNGAKRAMQQANLRLPVFVQMTAETTGTLLVGTEIAAAATIAHALNVDSLGLNCATGPQEMAEHVKWLGENWPGLISVQPNAGLPLLVDGHAHYPLSPEQMAAWLERFVREDGVNLIGGCCGTTPAHIAALDEMLRRLGQPRPSAKTRSVVWTPAIASLYAQVPLRQENAYLAIGERCNANGSKAFRDRQAAGDWDGCVALGREQAKEGSHALDVCTAYVGRDEAAEMTEVIARLRGATPAPLVIDSTELVVLETALKLYGGKAVINSINFEDGEEPAAARLRLARRFGAAVIALTIDEPGMAKDADRKMAVAQRLYDFAVTQHGLAASDLMIDPLTFTICTGNEDDRKLGLETLDAIERIAKELPECQILLGLSNISFGLKPAARQVLNSVFLDQALKRGMTGAILHHSKILPLHKIPQDEVKAAEDLIYDRRAPSYDPLHVFIGLFTDREESSKTEAVVPKNVEERLAQRIVDGNRVGLDADLEEALQQHSPLDIINQFLLQGMKVVGELFGAGKMQLPFVLQSAETMKAAVAHLEPKMDRAEGSQKATIVLATVKGDVHDIGKNLVDIILTNNGYKVINLGIKQPIGNVIAAAREHNADAIGLSGLLVKSTVVMRESLVAMTREQLSYPVLLGGAALTRAYVEGDCVGAYSCGRVAYARDAFAGLDLMAKVASGTFDEYLAERQQDRGVRAVAIEASLARTAAANVGRPVEEEPSRVRRSELTKDAAIPAPPFWGARLVERAPVRALLPFLNETMLYQFHWGFRKSERDPREMKAILARLMQQCEAEDILQPSAAYGYWPAASDGDELVVFGAPGSNDEGREVWRFDLPRQNRTDGICIADFFRPVHSKQRDVIGLQVVTVGQRVADVAREWFAADRYQDYLYLHGLGVEIAEALAEYIHTKVRAELGFAHEDDRDMSRLLKHGYHGSRYSFGYPACPNLAHQYRLLELLGAERCGIVMGEEYQLWPEQSTSAIIVHHPQAKYFAV